MPRSFIVALDTNILAHKLDWLHLWAQAWNKLRATVVIPPQVMAEGANLPAKQRIAFETSLRTLRATIKDIVIWKDWRNRDKDGVRFTPTAHRFCRLKGDGDVLNQVHEISEFLEREVVVIATCDKLMQARCASLSTSRFPVGGFKTLGMESGTTQHDPTSVEDAVSLTVQCVVDK